jgi:mitochondrial fission protein ELM1
MSESPAVWVLLSKGAGDNNQLLRLANELRLPFRAVQPRYNPLHLVPPRILGSSLASLRPQTREEIRPPWPRLVLGIGYRSVPAALAIRELSGGTAKLVRIGNPRLDPARFDLVLTTAQYPVPQAPNVLRLTPGLATVPDLQPSEEESRWLDQFPRPHRLLLIGGDQFMWKLKPATVAAVARNIARKKGGSVIAVSSPRSRSSVLKAVEVALAGTKHGLVWGEFPRYPALLAAADEIYVTADSVSMISDAVATQKPVGLALPEKSATGRLLYALSGLFGRVPVRDVQSFWQAVQAQKLAGTVARPVAEKAEADSLGLAVAAIRKLL